MFFQAILLILSFRFRQSRELHEIQRRQKEEKEYFLRNAIRHIQKTNAAQEVSQSQDSNRSTPDLVRDWQVANTGQPVARQSSCDREPTQADQPEKKSSSRLSDDAKLNELTMRQLDSMSRATKAKSTLQTKADTRVSRPTLNQLKLTQQQQMAIPLSKQPNAKGGSMNSNYAQQNSTTENTQALPPNDTSKSEHWRMRQPDGSTSAGSMDSKKGYTTSSQVPVTCATIGSYTHTKAVSQVPVTHHPAAQVPAAQVPVTQVPVTHYQAAQIPVTKVPVTHYQAAQVPVTQVPVTHFAGTHVPVTQVPVNNFPVTCSAQSLKSVAAGHEPISSTPAFIATNNTNKNDPWYRNNSSK